MCDRHSLGFRKFAFMWLFGVIILEVVLCSTLDVHRIVLKPFQRKTRDRDYYKYHPVHRQIRKPHAYNQDEWSSATIKTDNQYYNYRTNHKNESNIYKRGKFRNFTTPLSVPLLNIPFIEPTTLVPQKLPSPVTESVFRSTRPFNTSLDFRSVEVKRPFVNFSRNFTPPRNVSKGYEVYEEIIEDITPPSHNVLINLNPKLHRTTTTSTTTTDATVVQTEVENHIKENITNHTEESVTRYGKRTNSGRNRGSVKFE